MAQTKTVGLDLGSYTIKVVELSKNNKKFKLENAGAIATPPGGLLSESKVEQEAVVQAIKKLFHDSKISSNEVRVALPESQVYTLVIETPPLSEKELASSIRWEAEQYIPIPLDEVVIDWRILIQGKKEGEKNQVLLVGAPKRIIDKYQAVSERAGLIPVSLETELISTSRALLSTVPQLPTIMVVNIGAGTTDFSILTQGILTFTRSIPTGGMAFTRALKQDLQLEESQAEEYKKAYGFQEDKLEGKAAAVLKPLMNSIAKELQKGIGFFKEKYPEQKINVVLFSGGSSALPGLIPFFAQELGIETQIGNPWVNVEIDSKLSQNFSQTEGALYAVATGLAMREG